jgi:hypothetical protein
LTQFTGLCHTAEVRFIFSPLIFSSLVPAARPTTPLRMLLHSPRLEAANAGVVRAMRLKHQRSLRRRRTLQSSGQRARSSRSTARHQRSPRRWRASGSWRRACRARSDDVRKGRKEASYWLARPRVRCCERERLGTQAVSTLATRGRR